MNDKRHSCENSGLSMQLPPIALVKSEFHQVVNLLSQLLTRTLHQSGGTREGDTKATINQYLTSKRLSGPHIRNHPTPFEVGTFWMLC